MQHRKGQANNRYQRKGVNIAWPNTQPAKAVDIAMSNT